MKMKLFAFGILCIAGIACLISACGDDDEPAGGDGDTDTDTDTDADTDTEETDTTLPALDNFDTDQYANPEAACDPQPENLNLTAEVTTDETTGDSTAWVGQCQNRFGIQGVWYPYDDNDKGGSSDITLDYTSAPEGKICAAGTAGQVMYENYSKYWGAGFGLNLCTVGEEGDREISVLDGCTLFDSRTTIAGFRITIEGDLPSGGSELRVQFSEENRSESAYLIVSSEGTVDYLFEDAEVSYAVDRGDTDVVPIHPDQIIALQFQISTVVDGDTPFDFCVSNIIPILE